MRRVGYARVSTQEQKEDRQIDELRALGIKDKDLFTDKASGKNFDRPKYRKMFAELKEGDTLFIKSIDRLGRNYKQIGEEWRKITKEKKADIVVLDMPLLDTRKDKNFLGELISDLVISLIAFVAETEYTKIHERQREGIEAAKRRGVKFGRPRVEKPEGFDELAKAYFSGDLMQKDISERTGIKQSTLCAFIENYRLEHAAEVLALEAIKREKSRERRRVLQKKGAAKKRENTEKKVAEMFPDFDDLAKKIILGGMLQKDIAEKTGISRAYVSIRLAKWKEENPERTAELEKLKKSPEWRKENAQIKKKKELEETRRKGREALEKLKKKKR